VPLFIGGYPFGIANVPVNLVDRVEVYRGVVPIRFGADALGGAINLARDQRYDPALQASYMVGSFGTHRATAAGQYRHDRTGFVAAATAFLDSARNDYPVDVQIPDDRGRLSPATVDRFHDGYRAYGATAEIGVIDKPWARRLTVQGVATGYAKELQHNVVMTVPYGEVNYGERVYGVNSRYEVEFGHGLELEVLGAYAYRTIDFQPTGSTAPTVVPS
jgi:outer membrane receptor protein involved in Fe transport